MLRKSFFYLRSIQHRCKLVPARGILIDTQSTPNPHSMKFYPGEEVLPESIGTGLFFQAGELKEINKSPLAKLIFAVDGIKSVFLGKDFITVTKASSESWVVLRPLLFSAIFDFYSLNKPAVELHDSVSDTSILETDDEVVAAIKELIETRVRPSVQDDGGDIFYAGFDPADGIVKVKLAGSCVGCPSSAITLRNGVEKMLMHYIPEVKGILEVESSSS